MLGATGLGHSLGRLVLLGRLDVALVVVVEEHQVADENEGQEEEQQHQQLHLVSHSMATPRSTQ